MVLIIGIGIPTKQHLSSVTTLEGIKRLLIALLGMLGMGVYHLLIVMIEGIGTRSGLAISYAGIRLLDVMTASHALTPWCIGRFLL